MILNLHWCLILLYQLLLLLLDFIIYTLWVKLLSGVISNLLSWSKLSFRRLRRNSNATREAWLLIGNKLLPMRLDLLLMNFRLLPSLRAAPSEMGRVSHIWDLLTIINIFANAKCIELIIIKLFRWVLLK